MKAKENPGEATGALQSASDLEDRTQSSDFLPPAWIYDAEARAAGYRLAVQCLDCDSWLVSAKSVAAHRGPVCRSRRSGGRQ